MEVRLLCSHDLVGISVSRYHVGAPGFLPLFISNGGEIVQHPFNSTTWLALLEISHKPILYAMPLIPILLIVASLGTGRNAADAQMTDMQAIDRFESGSSLLYWTGG
jgi:hypothetical protein